MNYRSLCIITILLFSVSGFGQNYELNLQLGGGLSSGGAGHPELLQHRDASEIGMNVSLTFSPFLDGDRDKFGWIVQADYLVSAFTMEGHSLEVSIDPFYGFSRPEPGHSATIYSYSEYIGVGGGLNFVQRLGKPWGGTLAFTSPALLTFHYHVSDGAFTDSDVSSSTTNEFDSYHISAGLKVIPGLRWSSSSWSFYLTSPLSIAIPFEQRMNRYGAFQRFSYLNVNLGVGYLF